MKTTVRTLLLAVGLALTQTVAAQAGNLVGTWQWTFTLGTIPCTAQTIYGANGKYSEMSRCGPYAVQQAGTYSVSGNRISRAVVDWAPKTHWVIDLCPGDSSRPGCGHYEQYPKPVAGQFGFTFLDANRVRMTDLATGAPIVLHRVQ